MGIISHQSDIVIDKFLRGIVIDPDKISYLSVVLSIFTAFIPGLFLKLLYVQLILFLDLFDGYFARKRGKTNPTMDYVCDRASEIAMFIISPIWLGVAIINSLITALIPRYKFLRPIPLRQTYFLFLLIIFINGFI